VTLLVLVAGLVCYLTFPTLRAQLSSGVALLLHGDLIGLHQTTYWQQELLMKHALYFALGGALIGIALTTWLAPGLITWYFKPPVEMGGFSCTAPIQWALRRLQRVQLWGVVVGGVLGLVMYGVVQMRHRRKQAQPGSSPDSNSNEQGPRS
jgi:hypothetical protein